VRGAFRIGLNETSIGLALPTLGIELARDRLAPAMLTQSVIRATLYAPDDAVVAGYLDEAVDADGFDAAITQAAHGLLALDAAAYAATKRRLRQPTLDRSAG
jgi:enoyl-CoA hydratase